MSESVCLNGEIVPAREARVSVFDAGFTHAAGLFETMRVYNGRVMRLPEHIHRLNHSANTLAMQVSVSREEIARSVDRLLEANGLCDARVRLTVTPGNVPRPGQVGDAAPRPTVVLTAAPVRAYPADLYRHGMRVCICPYRQNAANPLAGHKTLAYLPRLMALKEAADRKCNEALWFTTNNQLAEGSVCNVFIVRDGTIATPPEDTPLLPGTVRKAVLELARTKGMTIEEHAIDIDALLAAQEVFLTGSVLEIMPVTAVERHTIGAGVPGDITRRVSELYHQLVRKECGQDG